MDAPKLVLCAEKAAGLNLTQVKKYLDCASGIAVNTLGHSHPHLVAALTEQAGKLWHTSNLYRIPGQEIVAKMLASLSGLDQVFFCNSGAEATEAAVKIARRAAYEKGEPEADDHSVCDGRFSWPDIRHACGD